LRRRGQEGLTEQRGKEPEKRGSHGATATAQEGCIYSEAKGSGSPIEKSYALDHMGKIDIPGLERLPSAERRERDEGL
jgi:hypothetical protein